MRRLRVVTWNVHRCRGLDGRTRPVRVDELRDHFALRSRQALIASDHVPVVADFELR